MTAGILRYLVEGNKNSLEEASIISALKLFLKVTCKIKSLRNSKRLWNHLKSRQYRMEHLLPPQETDHKCAFFLSPLSLSILPHFLYFLESPPTQLLSATFLPLGLLLKDSKLVRQVSNPITPTTVQIQNNAVTSVSFLRPLCSQSSLPTHNLSNH